MKKTAPLSTPTSSRSRPRVVVEISSPSSAMRARRPSASIRTSPTARSKLRLHHRARHPAPWHPPRSRAPRQPLRRATSGQSLAPPAEPWHPRRRPAPSRSGLRGGRPAAGRAPRDRGRRLDHPGAPAHRPVLERRRSYSRTALMPLPRSGPVARRGREQLEQGLHHPRETALGGCAAMPDVLPRAGCEPRRSSGMISVRIRPRSCSS